MRALQFAAVFLLAMLMLVSLSAHSQTAERPIWKVGYKWAFHSVAGLPPTESDWTREVSDASKDGKFVVRTGTGQLLTFDGETNSLDARGPSYSWKRFDFPLTVGKKWTHNREIGSPPDNGHETATWEVKAYEKVTVPAGTFDCFRIEGVVWQTQPSSIYTPRQGHQEATNWYCPEVKWVAKWKSRARGSIFAPYVHSESVLTSFSASD